MASVAYTLHNVFAVSPQAEPKMPMPASHREAKSKNCANQSQAESQCGSYIDLDELLESSGEGPNEFEGIIGSS